ncbi:hypothetical protein KKG46_04800 [Patescibacteria group bacterium]|nr:hypothetical protein [Patescibacteria group bacterium]
MKKSLIYTSILALALFITTMPVSAALPIINTPSAKMPLPVIDPAALPAIPELTLNDDWINKLKPIPLPDIKIPPELLKGPTISNIQMSADNSLLLVSWTTNSKATSKVEYGESSTYTKSLEDKNLVNEHSMVIPANPGSIHLQILSKDSLNRESSSGDIVVLVPNTPVAQEDATTSSPAEPTTEPSVTTTQELPDHQEDIIATSTEKVILDTNEMGQPKLAANQEDDQGLSITETILGGVALLLAGILIGVLVNRSKKSKE